MLVDFGRSIDLLDAPTTSFVGNASQPAMMCVAMRQGLPWSLDIDTFGVCASAHVLLFASHLEIDRHGDELWMPGESLDDCHELWKDFFGSLLNPKSSFSTSSLRDRIKDYLEDHQDSHRAALDYQSKLLKQR